MKRARLAMLLALSPAAAGRRRCADAAALRRHGGREVVELRGAATVGCRHTAHLCRSATSALTESFGGIADSLKAAEV
jgi:hypothetical protein